MTTLVVGASGATGKLLVEQLLTSGQRVKIIVRPASNVPHTWHSKEQLTMIKGNVTDITLEEMADYIADCQAVACCLGHNMSLKGIYGKPRKLVFDTVRLLCEAVKKNTPDRPFKFVLMNTAGNRNRDINEAISLGERMVIGLVRVFLPPHPDNEKAADYLRINVGQGNPYIEWVVVRPDTLINEERVSQFSLHTSPTRSALFNPGKTSRINVANLMTRLIRDEKLWITWKGRMPVIYNDSN